MLQWEMTHKVVIGQGSLAHTFKVIFIKLTSREYKTQHWKCGWWHQRALFLCVESDSTLQGCFIFRMRTWIYDSSLPLYHWVPWGFVWPSEAWWWCPGYQFRRNLPGSNEHCKELWEKRHIHKDFTEQSRLSVVIDIICVAKKKVGSEDLGEA